MYMMSEQLRHQENQLTPEQVLNAGAEFLEHFGVELDPVNDYANFMEAMNQLNPRFSGERELVRYELEADQTEWSEDSKGVIMRAAEGMRMLESETPLTGDFDLVIALGGARQSNLDRTRYAAGAIANGEATASKVVVSGTDRELKEAEQDNTANYAPGAKTEFDLCAGAAKTVKEENPELNVTAQRVPSHHYLTIMFGEIGTPSVIEDALSSFKTGLDVVYPRGKKDVLRAARVGVVTTQIYQASTELDLARIAKRFGITETQTAGNPSDPKVIEARTPATYLSEVCRTLRAAASALKERSVAKALPSLGMTEAELENEPRFGRRLNSDGSSTVRAYNGNEYVVEADGSSWLRYYEMSGLMYDGPDDLVGKHPGYP